MVAGSEAANTASTRPGLTLWKVIADAQDQIGSLSIPLEQTVADIVFVRQPETGAKIDW